MNPTPVQHPPGQAKHPLSLREEARWLYRRGSTLREIADALGVPMRTIQSWKNRKPLGWRRPVPVTEGPGGLHLEQSPFEPFFSGTGMVTQRVGAWLARCSPEELRLVDNAVVSVREGMRHPAVQRQARMIEKLKRHAIWGTVAGEAHDVQIAAMTLAEVAGLDGECWNAIKGVVRALDTARATTW